MTSQKKHSQRPHIKNGDRKERRYYTRKQRQAYYEQWQSSDQNKAQFCRTHHIPRSNFYKWVSEFESNEPPVSQVSKAFAFLPMKTTAQTQPLISTIELHLTSGHYFRIPASIDGAQLKVLMEVIE